MQISHKSYIFQDHLDPEELLLLYKEKFHLREVSVQLENCDKIWETLQLIKNIQGDSNDDDNDNSSYQDDPPKSPSSSHLESPIPPIPYQPTIGNSNAALPDFRFSVKSKKKFYHCVSCGKEYSDCQQLRQHAYENHGVYVNPKRIYNARTEVITKTTRESANLIDVNRSSELQTPDNMVKIPLSQTTLPPVATVQTVPSTEILNTENSENSALSINAIVPEPVPKASHHKLPVTKGRIRCILCKRVCTDIVSHMKGYHKVGCVRSIIAQCEKIVDDVPAVETTQPAVETTQPDTPSPMVPEPKDLNEPSTVTVRKRKRGRARWTLAKKKFKQSTSKSVRLPTETAAVGSKKFKCDICLGIYKNAKTFTYHRKLHRMRGETPENFDPMKCKFKNSPLRNFQTNKLSKENLSDHVLLEKEPTKIESLTNDLEVQNENAKPLNKVEEDNVQNINNQSSVEPTVCECGRSFRNYHTLFLHKVKCKEIDGKGSPTNDSDSSIGISIKIKKNKNDSYEVVPRTTPIDEKFKEARSCKDSDVSSNDSGVVSVASDSQKVDSSESDKYKTHSVMRIRVEDNDEEVDIEDENSNQSNFNGNYYTPFKGRIEDSADTASTVSAENDLLQNGSISEKNSSQSSSIPTLINLCR